MPFFLTNCHKLVRLLQNEWRKNMLLFTFPLPCLGGLQLYLMTLRQPQLNLDQTGLLILLIFFVVLAISYGLQAFSGEADRQTLDFLLTKPLSPLAILTVKYITSLVILLFWFSWASHLLRIDLEKIALLRDFDQDWFLLFLIIIHVVSLFSGLLAKGLERLLVISLMSGGLALISYQLWSRLFELLMANYYIIDIPPYQLAFVLKGVPLIFTIGSLAIPLAGSLWILKSRLKLWRFGPAQWLSGLWILLFLLILGSERLLAPVLWPWNTARYGDWHETGGIVLAGPQNSRYEFDQPPAGTLWELKLAQPGQKYQHLYRGPDLKKPRFSPDGSMISFSAGNEIFIYDLTTHKNKKIDQGRVAAWSHDSQKILYLQETEDPQQKKIYDFNLNTQQKELVYPKPLKIADLYWDSQHQRICLFGNKNEIFIFNTEKEKITPIVYDKDQNKLLSFALELPVIRFNPPTETLYLGQKFSKGFRIYQLSLKTKRISFFKAKQLSFHDEKYNFRIKARSPLLINSNLLTLIWQNFDGGFHYEATYFAAEAGHELFHKQHPEHHHEHEEDHPEEH